MIFNERNPENRKKKDGMKARNFLKNEAKNFDYLIERTLK